MTTRTIPFKRSAFWLILLMSFWPLTAPGLNSKSLFIVLGLALLVVFIALSINRIKDREINKYLLPFIGCVLVTIIIRGIDFEILGGRGRGGFLYLSVLTPMLFILYSQTIVTKSSKFRKYLIFLYWGNVVINVIQLLYSINLIELPSFLIDVQNVEFSGNPGTGLNDFGVYRIVYFSQLSMNLFVLALLTRKRNVIKLREILLFILSLLLGSLSGHRIAIVTLIGYLLVAVYFSNDIIRRKTVVMFKVLLAVFIIVTILLSAVKVMPNVVVRSFSWIPGIVDDDAQQTSSWRIELWRIAWTYEVPKFLWIGKGLSQTYDNRINIFGYEDKYTNFIDSINYHQGLLSILICLGLPALVFFILFHVVIIKRIFSLKNLLISENSSKSSVLQSTLISIYLTKIFVYFFIYGDLSGSFIYLHVAAVCLIVGYHNKCYSQQTADQQAVT